MKLTCNKEKFAQLFALASSAASLRDVKAVLQNVKLIASDGVVTLMATDMDISVRLEMDGATVPEPGETILPTRLIRNSLQASNDSVFTLESDGQRISLFGDRYAKIPTQPADDFPDIPAFAADAYHEIPSRILREMIRRTTFAIELENTKYTLGGVLLEFTEGRVAAVATDGRRLANQEASGTGVGGHTSENSAIVPLKALTLLDKALGSDEEPVKVSVTGGKIAFACGLSTLTTRLIEGRFPRWKNIVPNTEGRSKVDLMVGPFLQAVRQAEIVTTDKQPGIFLDFSDNKLELSASGAEVGESRIELPVVYTGEKTRLKLEPRYLTDFLKTLDSDKVIALYMKGDQSVLFQTDDGYNYVVMPLT